MTAVPLCLDDVSLPDKDDWTVDDLASLPEDLRYELIDGRLILPSPTAIHQHLCARVSLALEANCPLGYLSVVDLSLKIDRSNEPRPDVVVLDVRHAAVTPAPVEGALLAVEVISPTSHYRDLVAKVKVFAAAGIEHYWVIDPQLDDAGLVLTAHRLGPNGGYEVVASTRQVFITDKPYPVTLDLPALTARLRALLGQGDAAGR